MPKNVYSYLDSAVQNPSSQRTLNALPGDISNGGIIKFPRSLGADIGSPIEGNIKHRTTQSIPFTIFMPYKRNVGQIGVGMGAGDLGGFHSLNELKNLPAPTFAIALPTPTSALQTTYDATYNQFNIGQGIGVGSKGLGAVITAMRDETINYAKDAGTATAIDKIKSAVSGAFEVGGVVKDQFKDKTFIQNQFAVAGVAAVSSGLQILGSGEDTVNAFIGQANNPYTENAFKNMEFRLHDFNYTFMPKNIEDSRSIDKIISLFKYGMMPKVGTSVGGTAFFDFPYEFQITHSIQDTTFTLLPSVLVSLNVDYGGGTDSPKLFRPGISDKEQYPAKITLSMKFKEMVLLTRDKVLYDSLYSKDGTPSNDNVKRYRF